MFAVRRTLSCCGKHVSFFKQSSLACTSGLRRTQIMLSPARLFSQQVAQQEHQAPKAVGYWLLGVGGLVGGMVVVGGITRLTKSGLSMTDWKLQGSKPPITQEEWQAEFDRYKAFPEWKQRQSMTLEEFKSIYFWEYAHRMMGRVIGLAYALPGAYFAARGMIPRSMYPRIALLFGLGGGQGLIGWWMVKSGLEMDPEQRKEIRVSPYRLATHLSMAFTTYVLLVWTGLDVLVGNKDRMRCIARNLSADTIKYAQRLRGMSGVTGLLVATTVLSGAYVAGNDAGRAYNTFPDMDGEWIPSEILSMQPIWRNFFENTATVQFDHRVVALTTLSSIALLYGTAHSGKGAATTAAAAATSGTAAATTSPAAVKLMPRLPRNTRRLLHLTAGMGVAQVGLGISTLLLYVPVELAAIHQAGALVLLSFVTALLHSLRFASGKVVKAATSVAGGSGPIIGGGVGSSSGLSGVSGGGVSSGGARLTGAVLNAGKAAPGAPVMSATAPSTSTFHPATRRHYGKQRQGHR